MKGELHIPNLVWGLAFVAFGIAFLFEATGAWAFTSRQFPYVFPVAMVVAGIALLAGKRSS